MSTIDGTSSTAGHTSSTRPNPLSTSSLPPATVPLYRMTRLEHGDQLYGNYEHERDGHTPSWLWKYEGLICRIWSEQGPGMVPLRRLYSPPKNIHCFTANDEDANWWINNEQSN